MNARNVKSILRNNDGIALVGVITLFVVLVIAITSVSIIVYSDTMFSVQNENKTTADHAATSAINVVEEAINQEVLNNDSKLQKLRAEIDEKVIDIQDFGPIDPDDPASVEGFNDLIGELETLKSKYGLLIGKVKANILPYTVGDTYEHNVGLSFGAMTTINPVKVTKIDDGYILQASAVTKNSLTDTKGQGKSTVSMKLEGIEWADKPYSYEKKTTTITAIEKSVEDPFKHMLKAKGGISADKDSKFLGKDGGSATFSSESKDYQIKSPKSPAPILKTTDTTFDQYGDVGGIVKLGLLMIPPDPDMARIDPDEPNYNLKFQSANKLAYGKTVNHTDSGYYGQWSTSKNHVLNVNTNGGNVILAFSEIQLNKENVINVYGNGNYKLYIYVNGTLTTDKDLIINTDGADVLLIGGSSATKVHIKKEGGMSLFIFTPNADIEIEKGKSNLEYKGAIVAKSIALNKEMVMRHCLPTPTADYKYNGSDMLVVVNETIIEDETVNFEIKVINGTLAKKFIKN